MKTKLIIIVVSFFYSTIAFTQIFNSGGINYKITSTTTVGVSDNQSFIGIANIPSSVNNGIDVYSVTSIDDLAFLYNTGLTSITIANSVLSIGSNSFRGCTGLTSLAIPNSVLSIGDGAFNGCSNLTSVTIPNSVTNIGNNAFRACSSLTSIAIPNSVISIEESTFNDCSSLTTVNIPNSVTSIGDHAFIRCRSLTNITIPNSVISIGSGAFVDCSSLTTVNIPNSVTSISDNLFLRCTALTNITIPNSVISIGSGTFYDCLSLTTVDIPNSVTSIGDNAFVRCTGLTSVTVNWTTPLPISSNNFIFFDVNLPTVCLYVPIGTQPLYDASPVWTDFNNCSLSTGVFEANNKKFKFYPNPTTNYFTIQYKENINENFEYQILDLLGRVVESGKSKFNEQINIENLTKGNYILQIETERKETLTEKLIKN